MSHAHDGGAAARKSIYRTAGILTGLTLIEFLIAGTKASWHTWMGIQESTAHTLVVVTFVILTIFKAFYIGLLSNLKAIRTKEYSSLIYVLKNTKNEI